MKEANAECSATKWRLFLRVLLFWGCYMGILLCTSWLKAKAPPNWSQLAWGLSSSVAILGVTTVFLRKEHRAFSEIGLGLGVMSVPRFVAGFTIGLATFGLVIVLTIIFFPQSVVAKGHGTASGAIIFTILTTLALVCMEELGFRAYPLRTLIRGLGFWPAQAAVAAAFGLCHLAFGWTFLNLFLGVVPSAFLFGIAATASGGWAIHICFNSR